jgi:uncharacterized protein (UPF0335 family)
MAASAKPTNQFDANKLKHYIHEIEDIKDDIDSETGSFMSTIKGKRNEIKDLIADAKNEGIPTKALKAELKLRDLDRDKAKVVAGLEEAEAETLEQIRSALGDFASLPLGDAVMKRAEARG